MRWKWLLVGLLLLGSFALVVVKAWPTRADGVGTIDECLWGYPVISLDGTSPYLPVMRWPAGLTYDYDLHVVVDASGRTVIHQGDRVVVRGTIRDMTGGDIPPCFVTYGIDLESIASD